VEADISAIKGTMQAGFGEIKLMLERNNNNRQIQLIATVGSVVVAVIGVIGYLITH